MLLDTLQAIGWELLMLVVLIAVFRSITLADPVLSTQNNRIYGDDAKIDCTTGWHTLFQVMVVLTLAYFILAKITFAIITMLLGAWFLLLLPRVYGDCQRARRPGS